MIDGNLAMRIVRVKKRGVVLIASHLSSFVEPSRECFGDDAVL